jgi:hypothetical protein
MAVIAVAPAWAGDCSGNDARSAPEPFSATTAGYLLSSTMLYSGSSVLAR